VQELRICVMGWVKEPCQWTVLRGTRKIGLSGSSGFFVISKLLGRYSKAKRRVPAYSRVL